MLARVEFRLIAEFGQADAPRLLRRWRDEWKSAFLSEEDFGEALRAGAVEVLCLRPIAEDVRDLLRGKSPAAAIDRVLRQLKIAADRSPDPTPDQVEWVRERTDALLHEIEVFGVESAHYEEDRRGPWDEHSLRNALAEWVDATDLARVVAKVRAWKRAKVAPTHIMASLIGEHFGLGRSFGRKVQKAIRESS
jgi:hypothetical protein